MTHRMVTTIVCTALLFGGAPGASAQQATKSELDQLKRLVEEQEKSIRALKSRIDELERRPTAPAAAAAPPGAPAPAPQVVTKPGYAPSPGEEAEALAFPQTEQSPIADRGNLDDRQQPAPRPGDYVLDPKYRGFVPIPRTIMMVKFNPKPRVDMMFNTRSPGGAPYRFAPALFPIEGTPGFGSEQFNATANGSQIRVDMRAPSQPGNFRLYYQNDFFGSDTKQMNYRLQHLYGQYYGVVAGFTYGVFEDPDSWPDTVDYEGPNALIFARRPLIHYTMEMAKHWNVTVGVEDQGLAIDTTGSETASSRQRAPDTGFNVRWEPGSLGHVQLSTILRSLAVTGTTGSDKAFGWGFNLSSSFAVTGNDTLQAMGVYGEGIGGLGNDSGFANTDAALDSKGNLVPLAYVSGLLAFSHNWTPRWRSTATYGYVQVDNTSQQDPTAYHATRYGSLNLIYQVYKRLSVGVEGLYGFREVKSGADTKDVVRVNIGAVYSPFD